jgi:hypothetical protein
MKIVDQFHHLSNLTRLYFDSCNCQNDKAGFRLIVNNIWSLPKLTYCHLDIGINEEENFCLPTKLSTSLKDLYMFRYNVTYNQIFKLFEYTSYLNSVSISFDSHNTNEDYKLSYFFMLTNLSIYVYRLSDTSKMIFFLAKRTQFTSIGCPFVVQYNQWISMGATHSELFARNESIYTDDEECISCRSKYTRKS